jgi:hypothetical protein
MAYSAAIIVHHISGDNQAVAWQADHLVCRVLEADACYSGLALCLGDIHADPQPERWADEENDQQQRQ